MLGFSGIKHICIYSQYLLDSRVTTLTRSRRIISNQYSVMKFVEA
jgi:hypothetical protein